MTPEQLKASILQMAIQGKLVEQKSEEGTAEELYQKIQKEKQKLIKDGKIKKEKPLEEIKEDEIPFDIPESWKWLRLGACGELERGSGIKKDEVIEEGYPCVRYGQLYTTYKTRFNKAVSFITQGLFEQCHKVHKNDVLMALTGENEYDIALAVTYEGDEEVAMGGDMTKFYSHCMNPLYLTYAINSKYAIMCKSKLASGNIIVHISNDKLAQIPIPIPPLEEQNRIVSKIEEILPYIDRYAVTYEKLEQLNTKFPEDMKKSILQYAIQGKLVEQRPEEGTGEELYQKIQKEKQKKGIKKNTKLLELVEEDYLFDIPESWKWVRIGEIFQTSSGTTPSKTNGSYYNKPDYNWVRTTDLNNGILKKAEIKISEKAKNDCKLSIIPYDSVCIAMYGGAGTIGKNALIRFDTTINQSVCAIHPNGFCDMKYLFYYIQFFRPLWMIYAAGSRKDPNINQIVINNAVFPLPPLKEQKRIVNKIEKMIPYCDQLIK